MRVYEIAKELGLGNKMMEDIIRGLGIEIKGVMARLDEDQCELVRKHVESVSVRSNKSKPGEEIHLERLFGKGPRTIPPTDPLPAMTVPLRAVPRAPARSIGWLHFTDLHQGMHGAGWLWPNVLALVLDDLRRLHDLCGPWDLVFFTGDLTQRGDAKEFEKLDETLARLWKHFEKLGSNPRLVCVPGNHDLVRPGEFDPIALALSLWQEHPSLRDHVFGSENNPYRARLREIFAAYTDWTQRTPWLLRDGLTEGATPGDFSHSLTVNGIDLGIVGLNSTFLHLTSENFYERLDIDPRQLHYVCDHYPPEWLQKHHINLLLTHHPPEWLAPRARQEFRNEIDLPGRFVAHFFGHMHEGVATSTNHGGGHARHAIQGASLFGLETHEGADRRNLLRIHGYSAGRFEVASAIDGTTRVQTRIFPRRLFTGPGGRRIDRDVQAHDLDDRGSFAFDAPAGKKS